ncbi:Ig-like domain-containing protein [Microbacterium sp. ARD32]|uniref:Ig-like domain-containing protein n=1 Tax=Microbacterium sp. ARD32 TaxID=2962577 RepID=UPI002882B5D2|nr:Ig-like domain-containing protein [Microbacterium sp. ARD32]MDT0156116.1 Ig-like domain-containing protein [Microbacterium sp. ARD32]
MKALSWMRARPKTLAATAGVVIGSVALTGMALAYDGLPTAKVDLNDAGVWLTKSSKLLVGHFNHASTVLDGGLRTSSDDYDILQDGGTVLVVDRGSSTLTAVDPANVALTDSATIPGSAEVALGNRTAAVLDAASGDLWVVGTSSLSGLDIKGGKPLIELGKNADVAVGQDGTVYAVSPEGGDLVTIPVDEQGEALEPSTSALDGVKDAEQPEITVVGDVPVVLVPSSGAVLTGGHRTEIENAKDAVLQQASASSDAVAVATPSALVRVPLDGADPTVSDLGSEGVPAAPVFLQGCTYGAWGGSARFLRDCAGERDDVDAKIPGGKRSKHLTFRVNRDVIVLNDIIGGEAWLADESLQRVDDWSILTPPEGDTEDTDESTEETVETSLPDRKKENTPPEAANDRLGVRPGGTTLLPVLDNDNDSDGDVLVASLVGEQPSIGQVQPILNGAALQIMAPEDASGRAVFTYQVDDGRENGTDTAKVTATVYDWDTNSSPKQKRRTKTKLSVESGGTLAYNVLQDWIDPEGDDLYLKGVEAADGDEVEFTTDGQMTYRAVGSLQGRKEVGVVVADSLGELTNGTILLDVKPAGTTAPVTNADHIVTRVGETATVAPLANDTSSGRDELRLSRVEPLDGTTIRPDYAKKQFTFRANAPGVYYVQYQASSGQADAKGIVRVDVMDEQDSELPPVAVRDVALLPSGKEALVGVLANDSDPAGGVLVVQSVSVPPHSGVAVSILNHEMLRISDQGALDEPVKITYRISNGSKSAEGDVTVVPIPAPSKLSPPVTHDDEAVVRAGDVVTIPVLDNDVHPNGDAMHVAPKLVDPLPDPAEGEAFVSQNTVRFKAADQPGTVYLTYEAVDTRGQKAGGHITVQVLPVDAEVNAPPHPADLTARTLAGASIRIPIPLDDIDTDGDSVELLGQDIAPVKGRITETGGDFLEYEAFADSHGVDSFTYRVRDRLGGEGTATIRVGIAPAESMNQAPFAVKDSVVVRPGRSVAVPVLANDSDPEGDEIRLVKDGITAADESGVTGKVSGDRVIVRVPDRELEASLQYTIRDAKGSEASAPILVTVDEDVPLMAPIARDDRLRVEDLKDSLTADLDILANDEDPDGTAAALEVRIEGGAKLIDGHKARITVTEKRQLIRYTITDQDEQSASAFIFVPSLSELRPTLRSTKPVEVKSGETKQLPLADYVTVVGGGSVRLTEAAKVSAGHDNGDSLIKDKTTLVYTPKKGYSGKDSLSFEVTDGKTVEDPKGRKSTLSIPITVLPPENQPPEFIDGQLDVAPGEDATSLDLAALTTDPDKGDADKLRYRITKGPGDGLNARLDGSTLLVDASRTTPKGTTASVVLSITDGTTDPIEGRVAVTVTASTRELPVASPDTVDEADQGETITVPVLKNDINPFKADGEPLKLLSAVPESGDGQAEVDGDQVKITSGADFVGVLVVRYRVQDATKDPDREVDGRVTVTVQGVPDAPGVPRVTTVEDRTVVLNWSAPSNNGAEIDHYTVTSVGGRPYSKTCATTTCTLEGLVNNVEYTFEVTAHNRVGDGPASALSEPARPDVKPETPLPPKLVFGDKALKVSWETPQSNGSPVESYTLQISPAPLSGPSERTGVTGNTLTWEGLENGTSYQVRVRAHNKAPDPSGYSMWSLDEVPAGIPGEVAAPTVNSAPSLGSEAQMSVSWNDADPNGDAVKNYDLLIYRGGTLFKTVKAGTATSQTVSVPTNAADYTYAVRATNKAGTSAASPQSTPRRAFGTPGAPSNVKLKEGDRTITITSYDMPASALNGAKPGEIRYQYLLKGSGSWTDWNGSSAIAATNGTSYTVQLRAYSVIDGQQSQAGPASAASNSVIPFGAPKAPTGSASKKGDQQITLGWNSGGSGNGRPVTTYIKIDGGGWKKVAGPNDKKSGTETVGNGYKQTHSIQVKVVATEGGEALSPVYKATTSNPPPPPPAKVWVTQGDPKGSCVNGCRQFIVNWENLNIGTKDVICYSSADGAIGNPPYRYSINFDGKGSKQIGCYKGRDDVNVWVDIQGWGDSVDTTKKFWSRP